MDKLPNEIIEHIGSYLVISDLHNFKQSVNWLEPVLERLYNLQMEHSKWKITTHLIFDEQLNSFKIDKGWISLGEFGNRYDIFHDHERCDDCVSCVSCDDCVNNSNNTHNTKHPQQIFTIIRKGIGGKILDNIVNNNNNNSSSNPDHNNKTIISIVNKNLENNVLEGTMVSINNFNLCVLVDNTNNSGDTKTTNYQPELLTGYTPYSLNNNHYPKDITYGLIGPL